MDLLDLPVELIMDIFDLISPEFIVYSLYYVSTEFMQASVFFLRTYHKNKKFSKIKLIIALCGYFNEYSNLDLFNKFNIDTEIYRSNMCTYAVRSENMICLKYFHDLGYYLTINTDIAAARSKSTKFLKYMYKNGRKFNNIQIVCSAAKSGSLECLKYLHRLGCPWNMDVFKTASISGSFECIKYLVENKCPCSVISVLGGLVSRRNLICIKYLCDKIDIMYGCQDKNMFAFKHPSEIRHVIYILALENNYVELLQYLDNLN